jgi:hypothetical protein
MSAYSEFDKRGIQLAVIAARLQKLRDWIGVVEYELNLLNEHPEIADWFDEDGVPILPLVDDQPLDVADCCETLEEAQGVIRRMEWRIKDLQNQLNAG